MTWHLPPLPMSRTTMKKVTTGIVAAIASLTLVCTTWTPAAADDLDDRKRELQQQIAAQSASVDDAEAVHDGAVRAAKEARQRLAEAEAALAVAQSEQDKAEELDAQRAEELAKAEKDLERAKADVAAAQAALDSVNRRLDQEIFVTTQNNSPLLNLAMLFDGLDTNNLNQRAQLAHTLFDSSMLELDELETRRLALEDAQQRADEAEQKATEVREAAAEQLRQKTAAADEAAVLRERVDQLAQDAAAAESAAANQVATEEKRYRDLRAESDSVERRIQERIAQAEAERKRKEAEEEERRKQEEANKGSDSGGSNSGGSGSGGSSSGGSGSAGGGSTSGSGFILPVGARITSHYGMRLHPVLGYWKLHDGTDFGASCGTPIKAANAGVVSERYYNGGYGNRLMIDHGRVNGSYVTTGYNHAQRYVVGVGQKVSKGQTIGYVGSTGYSTGCHLHLMVWDDGQLVNPMAKWFS